MSLVFVIKRLTDGNRQLSFDYFRRAITNSSQADGILIRNFRVWKQLHMSTYEHSVTYPPMRSTQRTLIESNELCCNSAEMMLISLD